VLEDLGPEPGLEADHLVSVPDHIAQILEQLPPVCDLDRVRGATAGAIRVGAAAIPANDADALVVGQPSCEGVCGPVGQQVDWAVASMSTITVPSFLPRRKAKSSAPISTNGPTVGSAIARTAHSNIDRETPTASCHVILGTVEANTCQMRK